MISYSNFIRFNIQLTFTYSKVKNKENSNLMLVNQQSFGNGEDKK